VDRLVRVACMAIPGVDFAGVSIGGFNGIDTVAASDPVAEHLDRFAVLAGPGPVSGRDPPPYGGPGHRHGG